MKGGGMDDGRSIQGYIRAVVGSGVEEAHHHAAPVPTGRDALHADDADADVARALRHLGWGRWMGV